MSTALIILFSFIALVITLGLILIGIYNRLVQLKNRYENAFAQIEVQLKRRYDLIPNIVEVAKAYIKHERETLESVVEARNQAVSGLKEASAHPGDPKAMEALVGAEQVLTGSMGRLFALAESYPDLKANQNMMQVSEELTSTENKVAFARQAFNDAIMNYNTYRESFPAVICAGIFGHSEEASLLKFEEEPIEVAPKVMF